MGFGSCIVNTHGKNNMHKEKLFPEHNSGITEFNKIFEWVLILFLLNRFVYWKNRIILINYSILYHVNEHWRRYDALKVQNICYVFYLFQWNI